MSRHRACSPQAYRQSKGTPHGKNHRRQIMFYTCRFRCQPTRITISFLSMGLLSVKSLVSLILLLKGVKSCTHAIQTSLSHNPSQEHLSQFTLEPKCNSATALQYHGRSSHWTADGFTKPSRIISHAQKAGDGCTDCTPVSQMNLLCTCVPLGYLPSHGTLRCCLSYFLVCSYPNHPSFLLFLKNLFTF